jgi:transcriptional regulator with XRE-family HTH domain
MKESPVLDLDLARRRREHLGLSQRDLALRLGIWQGSLANWELGKRRPDNTQLIAWARALGVRPVELDPALEQLAADLLSEPETTEVVEVGVGGVAATTGVRSEGPRAPDAPAVFPAATPPPRSRAS